MYKSIVTKTGDIGKQMNTMSTMSTPQRRIQKQVTQIPTGVLTSTHDSAKTGHSYQNIKRTSRCTSRLHENHLRLDHGLQCKPITVRLLRKIAVSQTKWQHAGMVAQGSSVRWVRTEAHTGWVQCVWQLRSPANPKATGGWGTKGLHLWGNSYYWLSGGQDLWSPGRGASRHICERVPSLC